MMAVTNIDSISLKTLAVPMEGLRLSLYSDITGFGSVSAHTLGRSLTETQWRGDWP